MAMQEGYWVVRTYEAGCVGEKTKFFVPGTRPTGKTRRREKAEIRKQEQNEYSALKSMARLIHANFSEGGLLLGLDYSDAGLEKAMQWAREEGMDPDAQSEEGINARWEAAAHALDNAMRRVKYRLKKQGLELKAIYITSDMDGESGEFVRVHHHLIINKEAREAFVDAWKELGHCAWSSLWEEQKDRTQLAEYLLRQVRRIPDAKKYRSTRNLIRPVPKDRVVATDAEIRMPAGSEPLFRQEFKPGRPQYIRYILPRFASGRYKLPETV